MLDKTKSKEERDEHLLKELDAKLEAALASLEAGRGIPASEVFSRLKKKFAIKKAA